MRMSRLLVRTLRDAPADAEAASHRLLLRAGYIRRLASGVTTFLPLGLRVMHNVERIVREEMNRAGAQELLLPILQPEELWEQSGRAAMLDAEYSAFRVEGRGGRFVLGPTHEEVVTATVAAEVDSWRDLPLTVYQVQSKFRDEARPRFGLLRGREFVMKDAYSFDTDPDAMRASYRAMYDAYCRIFDRCGLSYTPVEARSGAIGGDVNHEFMVPSAIGEDQFARCPTGDFASSLEVGRPPSAQTQPTSTEPMEEHHTPDCPGIDAVVGFFADRGLTADAMLKCITFVDADGAAVIALVPGDREVLPQPGWRVFTDDDFARHPHLVKGYIGPHASGVRVVADQATDLNRSWTTGANRADHHVTGAVHGRDFQVDEWVPLTAWRAGDACPRCGTLLTIERGVEAGHTFQLGLTYSSRLPDAAFVDHDGKERPYWMGCYGIGISRLVAVIAEAHHDDTGLMWPAEVAPFQVHLVSLRNAEDAAARLYDDLVAAGVPVLWDDRDVSPGVKFADADLIGVPVQVVVGSKGLARGVVERKVRSTGERSDLAVEEAARLLY